METQTVSDAMHGRARIDGAWCDADSGAVVDVLDPADDRLVGTVPACGPDETLRAIDAASRAFEPWASRSARDRAALLRRLADLMRRDADDLAQLMTREQGKPLVEARGEVEYAASFFDVAAEIAPHRSGAIVPAAAEGRRILVTHEPVGVVAIVTPWNFPLAMIARKAAPALAAGCTIVVKPDERTPLSAVALAERIEEAGFPPGTVGLVTGPPGPIGEAMLGDPRVRALSFTGSTDVGRLLMRGASRQLVRVSLELGGHAPFLVFEDADLEHAAAAAIACKFRNAGQTCICANRFLVAESIADEFLARLAAAMEGLRCGRGCESGTSVGPLIDDAAVAKVERHVADAVARGGRLLCGGERVALADLADRFYAPTLIDGLDDSMVMWREETFGPVAAVRRFRDESEAIAMANDTEYGLAAYFFTRDADRLIRVAEALRYGIVGANDAVPSCAEAPFGGVKQSGFGREGGPWAFEEFTNVKYVSWRLGR